MASGDKKSFPLAGVIQSSSRIVISQAQLQTPSPRGAKPQSYKVFVLPPSQLNSLGLIARNENGKVILTQRPVENAVTQAASPTSYPTVQFVKSPGGVQIQSGQSCSTAKIVTKKVVTSGGENKKGGVREFQMHRTPTKIPVPSSVGSPSTSRPIVARRSSSRRLLPQFTKHWKNSLEELGYIRCPLRGCNYICLNFGEMTIHYYQCKGEPFVSKFTCTPCNGRLKSEEDLKTHLIQTHSGQGRIAKKQLKKADVPQKPEEKAQVWIRKRAYSKVHKISWNIALGEKGYVNCFFKNCCFMALNLEQMIQHYGICNGTTASTAVECPYCEACAECLEKLEVHINKSHAGNPNILQIINSPVNDPLQDQSSVEASTSSVKTKNSYIKKRLSVPTTSHKQMNPTPPKSMAVNKTVQTVLSMADPLTDSLDSVHPVLYPSTTGESPASSASNIVDSEVHCLFSMYEDFDEQRGLDRDLSLDVKSNIVGRKVRSGCENSSTVLCKTYSKDNQRLVKDGTFIERITSPHSALPCSFSNTNSVCTDVNSVQDMRSSILEDVKNVMLIETKPEEPVVQKLHEFMSYCEQKSVSNDVNLSSYEPTLTCQEQRNVTETLESQRFQTTSEKQKGLKEDNVDENSKKCSAQYEIFQDTEPEYPQEYSLNVPGENNLDEPDINLHQRDPDDSNGRQVTEEDCLFSDPCTSSSLVSYTEDVEEYIIPEMLEIPEYVVAPQQTSIKPVDESRQELSTKQNVVSSKVPTKITRKHVPNIIASSQRKRKENCDRKVSEIRNESIVKTSPQDTIAVKPRSFTDPPKEVCVDIRLSPPDHSSNLMGNTLNDFQPHPLFADTDDVQSSESQLVNGQKSDSLNTFSNIQTIDLEQPSNTNNESLISDVRKKTLQNEKIDYQDFTVEDCMIIEMPLENSESILPDIADTELTGTKNAVVHGQEGLENMDQNFHQGDSFRNANELSQELSLGKEIICESSDVNEVQLQNEKIDVVDLNSGDCMVIEIPLESNESLLPDIVYTTRFTDSDAPVACIEKESDNIDQNYHKKDSCGKLNQELCSEKEIISDSVSSDVSEIQLQNKESDSVDLNAEDCEIIEVPQEKKESEPTTELTEIEPVQGRGKEDKNCHKEESFENVNKLNKESCVQRETISDSITSKVKEMQLQDEKIEDVDFNPENCMIIEMPLENKECILPDISDITRLTSTGDCNRVTLQTLNQNYDKNDSFGNIYEAKEDLIPEEEVTKASLTSDVDKIPLHNEKIDNVDLKPENSLNELENKEIKLLTVSDTTEITSPGDHDRVKIETSDQNYIKREFCGLQENYFENQINSHAIPGTLGETTNNSSVLSDIQLENSTIINVPYVPCEKSIDGDNKDEIHSRMENTVTLISSPAPSLQDKELGKLTNLSDEKFIPVSQEGVSSNSQIFKVEISESVEKFREEKLLDKTVANAGETISAKVELSRLVSEVIQSKVKFVLQSSNALSQSAKENSEFPVENLGTSSSVDICDQRTLLLPSVVDHAREEIKDVEIPSKDNEKSVEQKNIEIPETTSNYKQTNELKDSGNLELIPNLCAPTGIQTCVDNVANSSECISKECSASNKENNLFKIKPQLEKGEFCGTESISEIITVSQKDAGIVKPEVLDIEMTVESSIQTGINEETVLNKEELESGRSEIFKDKLTSETREKIKSEDENELCLKGSKIPSDVIPSLDIGSFPKTVLEHKLISVETDKIVENIEENELNLKDNAVPSEVISSSLEAVSTLSTVSECEVTYSVADELKNVQETERTFSDNQRLNSNDFSEIDCFRSLKFSGKNHSESSKVSVEQLTPSSSQFVEILSAEECRVPENIKNNEEDNSRQSSYVNQEPADADNDVSVCEIKIFPQMKKDETPEMENLLETNADLNVFELPSNLQIKKDNSGFTCSKTFISNISFTVSSDVKKDEDASSLKDSDEEHDPAENERNILATQTMIVSESLSHENNTIAENHKNTDAAPCEIPCSVVDIEKVSDKTYFQSEAVTESVMHTSKSFDENGDEEMKMQPDSNDILFENQSILSAFEKSEILPAEDEDSKLLKGDCSSDSVNQDGVEKVSAEFKDVKICATVENLSVTNVNSDTDILDPHQKVPIQQFYSSVLCDDQEKNETDGSVPESYSENLASVIGGSDSNNQDISEKQKDITSFPYKTAREEKLNEITKLKMSSNISSESPGILEVNSEKLPQNFESSDSYNKNMLDIQNVLVSSPYGSDVKKKIDEIPDSAHSSTIFSKSSEISKQVKSLNDVKHSFKESHLEHHDSSEKPLTIDEVISDTLPDKTHNVLIEKERDAKYIKREGETSSETSVNYEKGGKRCSEETDMQSSSSICLENLPMGISGYKEKALNDNKKYVEKLHDKLKSDVPHEFKRSEIIENAKLSACNDHMENNKQLTSLVCGDDDEKNIINVEVVLKDDDPPIQTETEIKSMVVSNEVTLSDAADHLKEKPGCYDTVSNEIEQNDFTLVAHSLDDKMCQVNRETTKETENSPNIELLVEQKDFVTPMVIENLVISDSFEVEKNGVKDTSSLESRKVSSSVEDTSHLEVTAEKESEGDIPVLDVSEQHDKFESCEEEEKCKENKFSLQEVSSNISCEIMEEKCAIELHPGATDDLEKEHSVVPSVSVLETSISSLPILKECIEEPRSQVLKDSVLCGTIEGKDDTSQMVCEDSEKYKFPNCQSSNELQNAESESVTNTPHSLDDSTFHENKTEQKLVDTQLSETCIENQDARHDTTSDQIILTSPFVPKHVTTEESAVSDLNMNTEISRTERPQICDNQHPKNIKSPLFCRELNDILPDAAQNKNETNLSSEMPIHQLPNQPGLECTEKDHSEFINSICEEPQQEETKQSSNDSIDVSLGKTAEEKQLHKRVVSESSVKHETDQILDSADEVVESESEGTEQKSSSIVLSAPNKAISSDAVKDENTIPSDAVRDENTIPEKDNSCSLEEKIVSELREKICVNLSEEIHESISLLEAHEKNSTETYQSINKSAIDSAIQEVTVPNSSDLSCNVSIVTDTKTISTLDTDLKSNFLDSPKVSREEQESEEAEFKKRNVTSESLSELPELSISGRKTVSASESNDISLRKKSLNTGTDVNDTICSETAPLPLRNQENFPKDKETSTAETSGIGKPLTFENLTLALAGEMYNNTEQESAHEMAKMNSFDNGKEMTPQEIFDKTFENCNLASSREASETDQKIYSTLDLQNILEGSDDSKHKVEEDDTSGAVIPKDINLNSPETKMLVRNIQQCHSVEMELVDKDAVMCANRQREETHCKRLDFPEVINTGSSCDKSKSEDLDSPQVVVNSGILRDESNCKSMNSPQLLINLDNLREENKSENVDSSPVVESFVNLKDENNTNSINIQEVGMSSSSSKNENNSENVDSSQVLSSESLGEGNSVLQGINSDSLRDDNVHKDVQSSQVVIVPDSLGDAINCEDINSQDVKSPNSSGNGSNCDEIESPLVQCDDVSNLLTNENLVQSFVSEEVEQSPENPIEVAKDTSKGSEEMAESCKVNVVKEENSCAKTFNFDDERNIKEQKKINAGAVLPYNGSGEIPFSGDNKIITLDNLKEICQPIKEVFKLELNCEFSRDVQASPLRKRRHSEDWTTQLKIGSEYGNYGRSLKRKRRSSFSCESTSDSGTAVTDQHNESRDLKDTIVNRNELATVDKCANIIENDATTSGSHVLSETIKSSLSNSSKDKQNLESKGVAQTCNDFSDNISVDQELKRKWDDTDQISVDYSNIQVTSNFETPENEVNVMSEQVSCEPQPKRQRRSVEKNTAEIESGRPERRQSLRRRILQNEDSSSNSSFGSACSNSDGQKPSRRGRKRKKIVSDENLNKSSVCNEPSNEGSEQHKEEFQKEAETEPQNRIEPFDSEQSVMSEDSVFSKTDSLNDIDTTSNHSLDLLDDSTGSMIGSIVSDESKDLPEDYHNEKELESASVEGEVSGRGRGNRRGKGRGRGRGRVQSRGRGKGRGKGLRGKGGSSSTSGYSDSHSHCEGPQLDPDEELQCGKCSEKMPRKNYEVHNIKVHNGMGWLEGEPPFDMKNQKNILSVLWKVVKIHRKVLTCESCGVTKKSAVGFLSHIEFCQLSAEERESMKVKCEVCGRSMIPASLKVHLQLHRNEGKPDLIIEPDTGRKKRAAAAKATSLMQEVIKEETQGDENKKNGDDSADLYRKMGPVRPSNPILSKWKRMIAAEGNAKCQFPGCPFKTPHMEIMIQHFSVCEKSPKRAFRCELCDFRTKSEREMKLHLESVHISAPVDSDPEEEGGTKGQSAKKCPVKTSGWKHYNKFLFLGREMYGSIHGDRPYIPTVKWTLKFIQENYSTDDLFPEYHTSIADWIPIQESAYEEYLPQAKESISFSTVVMRGEVVNTDSIQFQWKKMKLFESDILDDVPTLFTGGPIWALSWCTVPYSGTQSEEQFLAVGCHQQMSDTFKSNERYVGKGLIQVWNFGQLDNLQKSTTSPKFVLGIAHDYGVVWDLEWCPSGCYEKTQSPEHHQRLGLLAAACSDGYVHIFSVCFPASLESSGRYPLYKCKPVMTLQASSDINCELGGLPWCCLRLSWYKGKEHRIIAGGFNNGVVALWNLKTESSLLKRQEDKTDILLPYKSFQAHLSCVTALSLAPQDEGRYLMSGSIDTTIKVWDMEDTSGPIPPVARKGMVTDGEWLTHWLSSVISYDDVYNMGHCNTTLNPPRLHGFKVYPILPQNSVVWSLSSTDWVNGIAQSTQAGELTAIFPHQLLVNVDTEKGMKDKRMILSYIELKDIVNSNNEHKCEGLCPVPCPKKQLEGIKTEIENKQNNIKTKNEKVVFKLDEKEETNLSRLSFIVERNPRKGKQCEITLLENTSDSVSVSNSPVDDDNLAGDYSDETIECISMLDKNEKKLLINFKKDLERLNVSSKLKISFPYHNNEKKKSNSNDTVKEYLMVVETVKDDAAMEEIIEDSKGASSAIEGSEPEFSMPSDDYAAVESKYGIVFCDFPADDLSSIPAASRSRMRRPEGMRTAPVELYPITSLNKIKWNPNARSFLWIAAGYQCGLLRVPCISGMHNRDVEYYVQNPSVTGQYGKNRLRR